MPNQACSHKLRVGSRDRKCFLIVSVETVRARAPALRLAGRRRYGCYALFLSSYRARARTRVTSSGCSLSPIQVSTAIVTIWLI